jgi:hypothetical protein
MGVSRGGKLPILHIMPWTARTSSKENFDDILSWVGYNPLLSDSEDNPKDTLTQA